MKAVLLILLLHFAHLVSAQPDLDGAHYLEVTGTVPGPPMWQVKNGSNTLWIFGLLDPLPKNLTWDQGRVERIIEDAGAVISLPDLSPEEDIGLLKGITLYRYYRRMRTNMPGDDLEAVLPADVFESLVAAKELYGPGGRGLFRLRPLMAAVEIANAAQDSIDMESPRDINRRIRRLIRRSEAEIIQSSSTFEMPLRDLLLEIDTISLNAEIDCLRGVLEQLETDLQGMRERAYSWAYGYMGELYTMEIPDPATNCIETLTGGAGVAEILGSMRQLWLQDAQKALTGYETSFAVVPMNMLLNRDNLLDDLRDMGYEVIEP